MISENTQAQPLDKTAVMPSVISNDDLKLAHEKLQEAFKPIQAELDIAKEKYNKAKKELEVFGLDVQADYYGDEIYQLIVLFPTK